MQLFRMLILKPMMLLNLLISFREFVVDFLGFSTLTIMSFENRVIKRMRWLDGITDFHKSGREEQM